MIAIVDYGAGNLQSVKKAFDYIGAASRVFTTAEGLERADRLVLPGVGAFGAAAERLGQAGFFDLIKDWLARGRPFLGICLGMQLLLETSRESQGAPGFGFLRGECVRFGERKVPQIGWNQVKILKRSRLLTDIPDGSFFYFLHGYYIAAGERENVAATTDYGVTYPSVIEKDNVLAVQFHPEKSGELGLAMLRNWVTLC
jgi:glutamine amidotransferase